MYLRGTVIGPRLGMFWVIALWWASAHGLLSCATAILAHKVEVSLATFFVAEPCHGSQLEGFRVSCSSMVDSLVAVDTLVQIQKDVVPAGRVESEIADHVSAVLAGEPKLGAYNAGVGPDSSHRDMCYMRSFLIEMLVGEVSRS